ncbi:hypothetical protein [Frankia tisae]|uniref:hypothetical protein n=1 Tax=Frankia tisae TaxID=2950104 RepID=UPI0021BFF4C8|nr:hypothetical protein [Frankia tisae]
MSVDRRSLLGQRRLLHAVDIAGFGSLPGHRQKEAQKVLKRLMRRAFADAVANPGEVYLEGDKGDSALVVLPAAINEARTVADLVRSIRNQVSTHNRRGAFPQPLRLRLALGQGVVAGASPKGGLSGADVIRVFRMLDAAPTKDALTEDPSRQLVLVLTEDLFTSVVVPADSELQPQDFTIITVQERDAEAPVDAYLWVGPGIGVEGEGPVDRRSGPGAGPQVRGATDLATGKTAVHATDAPATDVPATDAPAAPGADGRPTGRVQPRGLVPPERIGEWFIERPFGP